MKETVAVVQTGFAVAGAAMRSAAEELSPAWFAG